MNKEVLENISSKSSCVTPVGRRVQNSFRRQVEIYADPILMSMWDPTLNFYRNRMPLGISYLEFMHMLLSLCHTAGPDALIF